MEAEIKNVLIVDDDEVLQHLLCDYLSTRNYRLYSAFTCHERKKYLQKRLIDIVILDVVLPDQNGLQCLQSLKANFPELPVLIHSPLDRSLDAHINRLRKKIEDDPAKPKLLKTVWGKGYRFFMSEQ